MNAKMTLAAASGLALVLCAGTARAYGDGPLAWCDPEGLLPSTTMLDEGFYDDSIEEASWRVGVSDADAFDTRSLSFGLRIGSGWDWCGPRWYSRRWYAGGVYTNGWYWSRPSWHRSYSGWYVRPRVIIVDQCAPVRELCSLPVVYPQQVWEPVYAPVCTPNCFPVYTSVYAPVCAPVYAPVYSYGYPYGGCGWGGSGLSLSFADDNFGFSLSLGFGGYRPGYVTHWPLGYEYHPWRQNHNYVTGPAVSPPRVVVNAPNNSGTIIINRGGTVVTDNGVVSRTNPAPAGPIADRGRSTDRGEFVKGQREPNIVRTAPGQVLTGGVVAGTPVAVARGEARTEPRGGPRSEPRIDARPDRGTFASRAPAPGSPEQLGIKARAEADAEINRLRARADAERASAEARGRASAGGTSGTLFSPSPATPTVAPRTPGAAGSPSRTIEVPSTARRSPERIDRTDRINQPTPTIAARPEPAPMPTAKPAPVPTPARIDRPGRTIEPARSIDPAPSIQPKPARTPTFEQPRPAARPAPAPVPTRTPPRVEMPAPAPARAKAPAPVAVPSAPAPMPAVKPVAPRGGDAPMNKPSAAQPAPRAAAPTMAPARVQAPMPNPAPSRSPAMSKPAAPAPSMAPAPGSNGGPMSGGQGNGGRGRK